MRSRKYQSALTTLDTNPARDVQREIDNYLQALRSYPESFAHNPRLSFEQHLFSIIGSKGPTGGERHTG